MTALRGTLYDGRTSAPIPVNVGLTADGRVRLEWASNTREYALDEIDVSARIGTTARRLTFADGAVCELADNDTVDRWLATQRAHGWQRGLFSLERRWPCALACAAAAIVATVAFLVVGIPALAGWTARVMPPSVDQMLGRGSLDLLDRLWLDESELPAERQAQIQSAFDAMRREIPDSDHFRLELRHSDAVGANAFALPSGVVVMTDQLVETVEHDDEMRAVLAHEVGHIVHRHTLRMMLQSSVSALLMLAILGDASAVSDLVVGVPTLLLQAGYSREFEREADAYARAWLAGHGIDGDPLGDLLLRLEAIRDEQRPAGYLASHPSARERAQAVSDPR